MVAVIHCTQQCKEKTLASVLKYPSLPVLSHPLLARALSLSLSRARTLCPSLGSALPSSIPHLILPCILIRTTDRAKYNDLLQLYPGAADDVNEDGKTPLALALSLNAADSVLYVAHTRPCFFCPYVIHTPTILFFRTRRARNCNAPT